MTVWISSYKETVRYMEDQRMTGKNQIYGKYNDEHVVFRCSEHTTLARLKQAAAVESGLRAKDD